MASSAEIDRSEPSQHLERVQVDDLDSAAVCLTFDEDLPHERGNRLYGVRHRKQADQVQPRIEQASLNSLPHGPELGGSGSSRDRGSREV